MPSWRGQGQFYLGPEKVIEYAVKVLCFKLYVTTFSPHCSQLILRAMERTLRCPCTRKKLHSLYWSNMLFRLTDLFKWVCTSISLEWLPAFTDDTKSEQICSSSFKRRLKYMNIRLKVTWISKWLFHGTVCLHRSFPCRCCSQFSSDLFLRLDLRHAVCIYFRGFPLPKRHCNYLLVT